MDDSPLYFDFQVKFIFIFFILGLAKILLAPKALGPNSDLP